MPMIFSQSHIKPFFAVAGGSPDVLANARSGRVSCDHWINSGLGCGDFDPLWVRTSLARKALCFVESAGSIDKPPTYCPLVDEFCVRCDGSTSANEWSLSVESPSRGSSRDRRSSGLKGVLELS